MSILLENIPGHLNYLMARKLKNIEVKISTSVFHRYRPKDFTNTVRQHQKGMLPLRIMDAIHGLIIIASQIMKFLGPISPLDELVKILIHDPAVSLHHLVSLKIVVKLVYRR